MLEAAAASVGLSLLFVVVYSGTNWFTSLRSDVGTWYFDWERFIPFVPLMVVPYMSIDLFFAAAPFLCRDRRELRTFSWRIGLAIVAAGIFFLAMPLKLGVTRPRLDGWLGAAFGWFFAADLPYNLCPSLHIALRTILAETYARHTSRYWRIAAAIWFSLIGFSALLTYQHHVVDVAGGFILAAVCFYLVPSIPQQRTVTPNRQIGLYYLLAAVAMTIAALLLRSWAMLLLWPAAACFIATIGYFGFGPAIYRKTDGRFPLSTRLVLAPLLLGQKLSLRYYSRQCRAWDEAAPNVWIGRQLSDREAADAIRAGVIGRPRSDGRILRSAAFPDDALFECPDSRSHRSDARTARSVHRVHRRQRTARRRLRPLQDRLFTHRRGGRLLLIGTPNRRIRRRGDRPLARRPPVDHHSSRSD